MKTRHKPKYGSPPSSRSASSKVELLQRWEAVKAEHRQHGERNANALRAVRAGVNAGLPPGRIVAELVQAWGYTDGGQELREALQTINAGKGFRADPNWFRREKRKADMAKTFRDYVPSRIRAMYRELDGEPPLQVLQASSPSVIEDEGQGLGAMAARALARIFRPGELLFMGRRECSGEKWVRTLEEWTRILEQVGDPPPQFSMNPLTGEWGKTNSGEDSLRAKGCVAARRHVSVEFDDICLQDQAAFFLYGIRHGGFPFKLKWIVFTGNKSLHALYEVDAKDEADWQRVVDLLDAMLHSNDITVHGPTGKDGTPTRKYPYRADKGCWSSANHLERLPFGINEKNGQVQRLLWLAGN